MVEYITLERFKPSVADYHKLNIHDKYKRTISIALDTILSSDFKQTINKILLFGSCAKQMTKGGSDVDILLISDKELTVEQTSELRRLIDTTTEQIGVDVDLVCYTAEMFNCGNMPLTKSIKENNIMLYSREAI